MGTSHWHLIIIIDYQLSLSKGRKINEWMISELGILLGLEGGHGEK
jgi:hypothetical protein